MKVAILYLLACACCSFLITYLITPSVIKLSYQKKLFDVPDERKVHSQPIPSLGGIGIFLGILIAFTLFSELPAFAGYKYILIAFLLLFFMGVKDDLLPMPASQKLIIQIAAAAVIAFGGLRITHLYGLFGIEDLSVPFSYLLTIVFIVGVTNAYNLIDGVDGLAGGLGIIGSLTLGVLLYYVQEYSFATLAFAVSGSLLAFLRYNFAIYPNKTFMGDCGSLLLGLTITILSIQFMQSPQTVEVLQIQSPLGIVMAIILIPVYDTLRVFTIRIASGKSPFSPDKNHIHHEFLRSDIGHYHTSLLLWTGNILLISAALFFRQEPTTFLLLVELLVGVSFVHFLVHLRQQRELKKIKALNHQLKLIHSENYLIS